MWAQRPQAYAHSCTFMFYVFFYVLKCKEYLVFACNPVGHFTVSMVVYSRVAVDMDIHGYIHGYIHVWISYLAIPWIYPWIFLFILIRMTDITILE